MINTAMMVDYVLVTLIGLTVTILCVDGIVGLVVLCGFLDKR